MPTDDPRTPPDGRPDDQRDARPDSRRDDRGDPRTGFDRRRFLTLAGGASALGLFAACTPDRPRASDASSTSVGRAPTTSAPGPPSPSASSTPATTSSTTTTGAASAAPGSSAGRVLVIVQLSGGNDGLNTLVPVDGRYHDNRPALGLPDTDLLAVPGTTAYGLHPSLAPFKSLLAAGQVAALEAIGYAHPNRSHFAALDDWWSATPGQSSTTGWLGRWLDATAGTDDDPLRAVALASGVPALTGTRVRPTIVASPQAFAFRPPRRADAHLLDQLTNVAPGDDPLAAAYRASIGRAASAVRTFATLPAVAPGAEAAASDDPTAGEITRSLATAAQLVAGHAPTRIVHVTAGGFDTHAGQLETHKMLLGDLALGVRTFFEQVTAAGQADRVLLMTVSEFGRRVHENGSGGTDHGKAGVQFVVGPSVNGGVFGRADLAQLDDGDLAPDIDVRSLYAMALDWLGGPTDEVLGRRYDTLGVVRR